MSKKIRFNDKKVIQGLILFCILIVITLSLIGDKGFFELRKLKAEEESLNAEIESLKNEKEHWHQKLQSLQNNRTYLENLARERLGMIRNDEKVIRFQEKPENP